MYAFFCHINILRFNNNFPISLVNGNLFFTGHFDSEHRDKKSKNKKLQLSVHFPFILFFLPLGGCLMLGVHFICCSLRYINTTMDVDG